ncbi:MAG: flagellar hook-length control protein FliK [Magnetococcales bacterium]|nr:flagellar hook-length control protein FliK [Magnetococcales bacterium]
MILSFIPPSPGASGPVSSTPFSAPDIPELFEGQMLAGRVANVGADGQGVIRFPNGSGISFSGGYALQAGEQVTLEVTRLTPEVGVRLVASESGGAAQLAQTAEQSLARGPELLGRLMLLSGLARGATGGTGESALLAGGRSGVLVAGRETLAGVLQRALPNVGLGDLMKGDLAGLTRVLEAGSRQEVADAVRLVRQAAEHLRHEPTQPANATTPATREEVAAEVAGARHALQRLGDLLALQHILPQAAASPEEGAYLLGYRLFWMNDGGLGEAVWRRERDRRRKEGKSGDGSLLSVLLSLNMTRMGMVQARLEHGAGLVRVAISAQEEASLVALRGGVGELRGALLEAGVPLHSLDLAMLGAGGMKAERAQFLGLGSGFHTEA